MDDWMVSRLAYDQPGPTGGVERALLDARRRVGVNCIVGVQGCGISSAHAGTQLMMHARLQ